MKHACVPADHFQGHLYLKMHEAATSCFGTYEAFHCPVCRRHIKKKQSISILLKIMQILS